MDDSFLAKQLLHGKLPPGDVHGLDHHVIPTDVVKSMRLGGTVDQLKVINGNIRVVAKQKGRKHQVAHRISTVFWICLGLGIVASAAIMIFLLILHTKPTCTSDSDCGANSTCLFMKNAEGEVSTTGTCTPAFSCTSDGDCSDGRSCLAGFCQPKSCSSSEDCLHGGALLGTAVYCDPLTFTCQAGCDEDSQCGNGLCNTTMHMCIEGACRVDKDGESTCSTYARCGAQPPASDVRATNAYSLCTNATSCVVPTGHDIGECKVPCDPEKNVCGDLGMTCGSSGVCELIPCTGTGSGTCQGGQVCTAAYAQGSADCANIWPVSPSGEGVCIDKCEIPPECGSPPSSCLPS